VRRVEVHYLAAAVESTMSVLVDLSCVSSAHREEGLHQSKKMVN